jgi:hypothetical protein
MKRIMASFILGCILAFSISVNAAEIGNQLTKIYDSVTGGKIDTFDKNGNLNARLGSERGDGDNVGGTLILYNCSDSKPRFSAGTLKNEDAGILLAMDKNNIARIQIQASNSNYNNLAFIGIRDKDQVLKTYFTEKYGYINGNPIVTMEDLKDYYTKDEVQSMIDEAVEKALKK